MSYPAIIKRLNGLLGEDLILWTGGFFIKEPNGVGRETPNAPGHQLLAARTSNKYHGLDCPIKRDRGKRPAADYSRLSQKMLPPTAEPGKLFGEEADPSLVDMSRAITLPKRAGQFIIFPNGSCTAWRPTIWLPGAAA